MTGGAAEFERIEPQGWRRPRGYSNGVLAPAGARVLCISGQVGWDQEERIVSEEFHRQFEQALQNVLTVLQSAGGKAEHVLRLTFFVLDREEYRREREAIGEHFRRLFGGHFPACTLVEVRGLLEPGAKVEIEATAAIPVKQGRRS